MQDTLIIIGDRIFHLPIPKDHRDPGNKYSMSWRMARTIIQREKQIHPSTNNYIHIANYVARLLPKNILKGPSELNAENLL